jgi:hypothetical protein
LPSLSFVQALTLGAGPLILQVDLQVSNSQLCAKWIDSVAGLKTHSHISQRHLSNAIIISGKYLALIVNLRVE